MAYLRGDYYGGDYYGGDPFLGGLLSLGAMPTSAIRARAYAGRHPAEAMYDRSVVARSMAGKIEIVGR